MVEIGGKPILWHIMKGYSNFGYNEFIICCGYKGYVIKEYFANYLLHNSDVTINLKDRSIDMHANNSEPWKVTLIDTGENTLTGGKIKKNYTLILKMRIISSLHMEMVLAMLILKNYIIFIAKIRKKPQ